VLGESAIEATARDRGLLDGMPGALSWTVRYLRVARTADFCCGLAAGLTAYSIRFDGTDYSPLSYFVFSLGLPFVWLVSVQLAGGYDARFIGVGTDEFRKVFNAGAVLISAVAILSYAAKLGLARGYVAIALPGVTILDLLVRYALRKRLHRVRRRGACMRKVVVVGHAPLVADLTRMLRRATHHGLDVVAACVAEGAESAVIAGVPAFTGFDQVPAVVRWSEADTVAVLACPEMSGHRLRQLAWDLEKTGTDLCVAPALLDVAGPRTTIRPVAGLPLLHMDHPGFTGGKLVIKLVFDKVIAFAVLVLSAPVFGLLALAIRLSDGPPVFFEQVRVGKDGRQFVLHKFRSMVRDAEVRLAVLAESNQQRGPLFKMRNDPRVTRVGRWMRRWSLDELPQLVNVLTGDMSLVGPRPALPREAAQYGEIVRRRLAVKPGMTGLWQVNGRADLSWNESVRLDLRYVEHWSLMLDLQILWKTCSAVLRGSGAY
jgi:exopolysaccharide biosynthesis polyprenyl glycosylphosphotransferase